MAVIWITLALLAACGWFGWRGGVLRRLIELVGVVAAVIVTARFAAGLAPWLAEHTGFDATGALVLAHVIMFAAALVVVRVVANLVTGVVHWTPLGWLDRMGGAVCGVLLGAMVVSVGLIAVSQAPGGERVRETYQAHPLGAVIYHAAPAIYQSAHRLVDGRADALWDRAVTVGREVADEAKQAVGEE